MPDGTSDTFPMLDDRRYVSVTIQAVNATIVGIREQEPAGFVPDRRFKQTETRFKVSMSPLF